MPWKLLDASGAISSYGHPREHLFNVLRLTRKSGKGYTVGRDIFAAAYFRDFFPHSAITMVTKCHFNRKSCDINSKALCCFVLLPVVTNP